MTTTTYSAAVTFEHILVPTDFSDVSQRALEYAKTLAKQGNSELLLAHVNLPMNLITPPEAAWIDTLEIQSREEQEFEERGAALRSEGYRAQALSLTGPLYDELLSAVKQYKVDLIVLGTHGKKGLERFLLGSDAEALLRHAHCPVISVGPEVPDLEGKAWQIREVLCATTLQPHSAEVVAYAQRVAAKQGAELVLLHVKEGAEETADWMSFEEAFHSYAPEVTGRILLVAYPDCEHSAGSEHRGPGQATGFRLNCHGRPPSRFDGDTPGARHRCQGPAWGALPRDDTVTGVGLPGRMRSESASASGSFVT